MLCSCTRRLFVINNICGRRWRDVELACQPEGKVMVFSSKRFVIGHIYDSETTDSPCSQYFVVQNIFMAAQLISRPVFTFKRNAIVKVRRMLPFQGTTASSFGQCKLFHCKLMESVFRPWQNYVK